MNVAGKTAIVTGGGSGIGRETCLMLADRSALVVVADLDESNGLSVAREIVARGGRADFFATDVRDQDSVKSLIDFTMTRYGHLDVLHNNAGILTGVPFPNGGRQYWLRAVEINLIGVLNTIYSAAIHLSDKRGVIVNTASEMGLQPYSDAVYAATKAAVINLTRSLALQIDDLGVRVNCICPGRANTSLADNTVAGMGDEERELFLAARSAFQGAPTVSVDRVATCVLRLIEDESLNGAVYKVVGDSEPEFV